MKAYQTVQIKVLYLNEEIVRTSGDPMGMEILNSHDDVIGDFVSAN